MNICPYCGAIMTNPRRRQCGAETCRLRHLADRQRAYLTAIRDRDGVRYEDRFMVTKPCLDCGAEIRTRSGAQRCLPCAHRKSSAAANVVRWARFAEAREQRKQLVPAGPLRPSETLIFRLALKRAERYASGTSSQRRIWVGASCHRCGNQFLCMWTNRLPRWCSRSCARLDAKVARRVRERDGRFRYSRHGIFTRDRWVCQLCGKRVKRSAAVPDPKAPVIDHIVPLAAGPEVGGVDAPWNVQCAHFLCNSIKRDQLAAPALF